MPAVCRVTLLPERVTMTVVNITLCPLMLPLVSICPVGVVFAWPIIGKQLHQILEVYNVLHCWLMLTSLNHSLVMLTSLLHQAMATVNTYRKFCKVWICGFLRYASRQTYRHAHHSTSHPYWGEVDFVKHTLYEDWQPLYRSISLLHC